jgi:hypothetical protein
MHFPIFHPFGVQFTGWIPLNYNNFIPSGFFLLTISGIIRNP